MTTQEAIKYFGNSYQGVADALGISYHAVYRWGTHPPLGRQFEIELVTRGKLKADRVTRNKKLAG
jgi:DNA invertase Pin-like site-specific DNA recombinase